MNRPVYFPPIDTSLFTSSAKTMQDVVRDAGTLSHVISTSHPFAQQLMHAAQQSNNPEVRRLLQTLGIRSAINTSFDPDSIRITLSRRANNIECCRLTVSFRWGLLGR